MSSTCKFDRIYGLKEICCFYDVGSTKQARVEEKLVPDKEAKQWL